MELSERLEVITKRCHTLKEREATKYETLGLPPAQFIKDIRAAIAKDASLKGYQFAIQELLGKIEITCMMVPGSKSYDPVPLTAVDRAEDIGWNGHTQRAATIPDDDEDDENEEEDPPVTKQGGNALPGITTELPGNYRETPQNGWKKIIADCNALSVGTPLAVDVIDLSMTQFTGALRGRLTAPDTEGSQYQWRVRRDPTGKNKVIVIKLGPAQEDSKPSGQLCFCGKTEKHPGRHRGQHHKPPEDLAPEKPLGSKAIAFINREENQSEIEQALREGNPVRAVAKMFGLGKSTIQKVRNGLDLTGCKCLCGKSAGHKGWCAKRMMAERVTETLEVTKATRVTEPVMQLPEPEWTDETPAPKALLPPSPSAEPYIPDNPPEFAELAERTVEWFTAGPDSDGKEWDDFCMKYNEEEGPRLAQAVLDHRKAKEITARHIDKWVNARDYFRENQDFDDDWKELYLAVHAAVLEAITTTRKKKD